MVDAKLTASGNSGDQRLSSFRPGCALAVSHATEYLSVPEKDLPNLRTWHGRCFGLTADLAPIIERSAARALGEIPVGALIALAVPVANIDRDGYVGHHLQKRHHGDPYDAGRRIVAAFLPQPIGGAEQQIRIPGPLNGAPWGCGPQCCWAQYRCLAAKDPRLSPKTTSLGLCPS